MNFLLHHRLAARDLASPAAGAGAMLPDLWRIADRRVRAAHVEVPVAADSRGALAEVLAGIEHHVAADKWFHADPVFVDGERATAAALRDAAIEAPRLGLFAHILWELCLDGALVRAQGAALLDEVRAGLHAAWRDDAAAHAATLHHFARVARSEAERATFDARMQRIFTELSRGPWLEGYARGEGIAERIDGIRARVGFAAMPLPDRARLGAVADALLDRAMETLVTLEASFTTRGAPGAREKPPLHGSRRSPP